VTVHASALMPRRHLGEKVGRLEPIRPLESSTHARFVSHRYRVAA
jgi:hypothetical protein